MAKILFYFFSLTLLLYLLMPGPGSIKDFPPLPNSYKSTLEGDTIQVPNVAGYFSDNFRGFATNFYRENFRDKTLLPFGPIRLNHPPEFAYKAIKDQTHSTYLEEFVYPMRGTLFVNGLEPFNEDLSLRYPGAAPFEEGGGEYFTKVTLRYYPTSTVVRLLVWLGIICGVALLWRAVREEVEGHPL